MRELRSRQRIPTLRFLLQSIFSEPFKDSNGYGESIARLSNMLGGGVIVQRFGDLIERKKKY